MTAHEITARIDATYHPTVAPGDSVRRGQRLSAESQAGYSPISGTVQSVHFDPETHEFVILITPAPDR